jgi:signal transduction histidine kinase
MHLARAEVRLAMLMRSVPLLQAVFTLTFGFAVYQRLWLGALAGCMVLCWSGYLGMRAWRGWGAEGNPMLVYLVDATVSAAVMVMLASAVPPTLLTTSFYWAGPHAQVVLLLAGLSLPRWIGVSVLAFVAAIYFLLVAAGPGSASLPVAAGNVAGMVACFGLGAVAGYYTRRLSGVLTQAAQQAQTREVRLGVLRARAEEFARLHDDAVQVLERVVGEDPCSAGVQVYASVAAARLRAAVSHQEGAGSSLLQALGTVSQGFGALGFRVRVVGDPVPCPGARPIGLLTAAVTEALNNAYKHSGAGAATIEVSGTQGGVAVTVEDQGRGFHTESVRHGFGLANSIFRRLEDAGGGAALRSAPGAGTSVRMWLPC